MKNHVANTHEGFIHCVRAGCKANPTLEDSQENHDFNFHNKGEFECQVCSKRFVRDHMLVEHVRKEHEEMEINTVKCQLCPKEFANMTSLSQHNRFHANENKKIQCNKCNKKFLPGSHEVCNYKVKGSFKEEEVESCGYKNCHLFGSASSMKSHREKVHNYETFAHKFESVLCGKNGTKATVLPNALICLKCGIEKTKHEEIVTHIQDHIKNGEQSMKTGNAFCVRCQRHYYGISIGNHGCKSIYVDANGEKVRSVTDSLIIAALETCTKNNKSLFKEVRGQTWKKYAIFPGKMIILNGEDCILVGDILEGFKMLDGKKAAKMTKVESLMQAVMYEESLALCNSKYSSNGHTYGDCYRCLALQIKLDENKIKKQNYPNIEKNMPIGMLVEASKTNYRSKIKISNIESGFWCDKCGHSFENEEVLQAHTKIHEKAYKEFKCDKCGRKFATKKQLTGHIKKEHSNGNHEVCDTCGKRFTGIQYLQLHKKRVHSGVVSKKSYKCQECPGGASSRDALKKHMNRYHDTNKRIFHVAPTSMCEVCGKAFWDANALEIHKRNEHKEILPLSQV